VCDVCVLCVCVVCGWVVITYFWHWTAEALLDKQSRDCVLVYVGPASFLPCSTQATLGAVNLEIQM